jgi:hypothetical protein
MNFWYKCFMGVGWVFGGSFLLSCGSRDIAPISGLSVVSCEGNPVMRPLQTLVLPDVPAQQTLRLHVSQKRPSLYLNDSGEGILLSQFSRTSPEKTVHLGFQQIQNLNINDEIKSQISESFGHIQPLIDPLGNGRMVITQMESYPENYPETTQQSLGLVVSPGGLDRFGLFQTLPFSNGNPSRTALKAAILNLKNFEEPVQFQEWQPESPLRWLGNTHALVDEQGNGTLSLMALEVSVPPVDSSEETTPAVLSPDSFRLVYVSVRDFKLHQQEIQTINLSLPNYQDYRMIRTWLNPEQNGMFLYRSGPQLFLRQVQAGQIGMLTNLGEGPDPHIEMDAQGNGYIYAQTNGAHRYFQLTGFQVVCSHIITLPVTEPIWAKAAFYGQQGVIVTLAQPKQPGTVGAADIRVHQIEGNQVVKSQTVVYPLSGTHRVQGDSLQLNLLPNGQGLISWVGSNATEGLLHVHSLKDFQPVDPLRWPGEIKPVPAPGPFPTPTPVFWNSSNQ